MVYDVEINLATYICRNQLAPPAASAPEPAAVVSAAAAANAASSTVTNKDINISNK